MFGRSVIPVMLLVAACSESTPPLAGGSVQLTASQVSTLDARIGQIVAGNSDLGWLSDSANLVLKEGTVLDTVHVSTDLGGGPFYGVGLSRAITTATTSSATYHAILFNDPSNPTRFIIVNGFSSTATGQGVTSSFGANVVGHLYVIDGSAVTHWRAAQGVASLNAGSNGGTCPSFVASSIVTCEVAPLTASFNISSSVRESGPGTGTRQADASAIILPGIRLRFQF